MHLQKSRIPHCLFQICSIQPIPQTHGQGLLARKTLPLWQKDLPDSYKCQIKGNMHSLLLIINVDNNLSVK